VTCKENGTTQKRTLTHLQFMTWDESGWPNPKSVINFMSAVWQMEDAQRVNAKISGGGGKTPLTVLVHCCDGCER